MPRNGRRRSGARSGHRPRVLSRIGHFGQTLVVSDSLIALEAGAPDSPGVVVATGTGSIAYGRDAAGPRGTRGRMGIRARRRRQRVLARQGGAARRAPRRRRPRSGDRVDRPGAPTLRRRASAGHRSRGLRDGVRPAAIAGAGDGGGSRGGGRRRDGAASILDEAARELTLLAVSVVEQLDLPEGPIVLAGGTLRAAPRLATDLVAALKERLPRAETRDARRRARLRRRAAGDRARARGTCGCRRIDRRPRTSFSSSLQASSLEPLFGSSSVCEGPTPGPRRARRRIESPASRRRLRARRVGARPSWP